MRKMVLIVDCGPGMHQYEAFLVPDDVSEKTLNEYAWERGIEFASNYGIYPMSDTPEDYDEDEEFDSYSDDISGYFVEYVADEHDGWLVCGDQEKIEWVKF